MKSYHKKTLEKVQAFLDSFKHPERHIDVSLGQAVAKEMERNMQFLVPTISTIVFNTRLGLFFRGHRDDRVPLILALTESTESIDIKDLRLLFQQWRNGEGSGCYQRIHADAIKIGDVQLEGRRGRRATAK